MPTRPSQEQQVLEKLQNNIEISVLDFPTGLRLSDRIYTLRKKYNINMVLKEVSDNSSIGFYSLDRQNPERTIEEQERLKRDNDLIKLKKLINIYPQEANSLISQG